jgi:predicted transglutaminase-like cysteine proteinase
MSPQITSQRFVKGRRMADAGNGRLKYIGVISLIVCACLAGYLRQRPALPQSEESLFIDGRYLELAAMVDTSPPQVEEQTAAVDHRSVRSLFGMETEPVVGGLASKWHAVELEIGHEEMVLAGCREQKSCPEPARELLNIIAEAAGRTCRARVGLINRAVDLAITPTADEAQLGVEDHWSSPLETLQSHRGDCEDYAIVKYVALREAGLSSADVKIVILRKLFPSEDHAVAAARVNGEWLILDNLHLTLVRDTDMTRAIPKFQLDDSGVHRFVPSSTSAQIAKSESIVSRNFHQGASGAPAQKRSAGSIRSRPPLAT